MKSESCCKGGVRELVRSKLGRCARCMRMAALGTLVGWTAFALTASVVRTPVVRWVALTVAILFTAVLLAHLLIFSVRAIRLLWAHEEGQATPRPSQVTQRASSYGRRQFLGSAAKAGAAFAAVLLARPLPAWAARCNAAHPQAKILTGRGCTEGAARKDLDNKAVAACDKVCNPLTDCGQRKRCTTNVATVIGVRCTRVNNPNCPRRRGWECTGSLVNCACKCVRGT